MDYEDNFIQLVDEDGTEFNFEHVLTFDYKDKKYVVLAPADEDVFEEDDVEELEALDGAEEKECCCHDEDCDCEECEGDDDGEIIILELGLDEEGNDLFLSIEDDDLLDELYNVYIETVQSLEE